MDLNGLAPVAVILAAMGGLLKVVLDYLSRLDARHDEAMRARDLQWQDALAVHRAATEKFLGNHMSNNTRAMEENTKILVALTNAVELLLEEDNV